MNDAIPEVLKKAGVMPALWLDGAWADSAEKLAVLNPATGTEITRISLADAGDFARAIDGAEMAFSKWKGEPAAVRADILKKAASLMVQRRREIGELLTTEQGKPLAQALGEVDYAASFFQWFGEEARRLSDRLQPHPVKGREYIVRHVPAGVAGLVTPWNFPIAQGAKKVAAALAAGCTAVWKPSELTPLVALAMGPILKEAGLPDGVLQILPAFGPVGGNALTADPRIRVLSLTGSTETGRTLMKAASQHLPKLSFELGGNAPFIVLPDADLDLAAADLVKLKVFVSGQVCVTANRIFVPATLEKEFTAKLVAIWKDLKVGNGLGEGVDVGPLIHSKACERVRDLVQKAVASGAEIVAENRSHEADKALSGGSFFPPTLIRGVRDDMALVTGEIFGPVAPILTYSDIPEAVRRANSTPYGLASFVYGRDLSVANGVAESLEVGIVGVNEWRPLRAEIPFGGVKTSGLGSEGGLEGILEYCEVKVISTLSAPRF